MQASYVKEKVSFDYLNSRLDVFKPLECTAVNKSYGSVFSIECGELLEFRFRQELFYEGVCSIVVEADYWRLIDHGDTVADAISVDRENFDSGPLQNLKGSQVIGICLKEINSLEFIELSLSDNKTIRIEISGDSEKNAPAITCNLPNGDIISFESQVGLYLSTEKSEKRVAYWGSKSR